MVIHKFFIMDNKMNIQSNLNNADKPELSCVRWTVIIRVYEEASITSFEKSFVSVNFKKSNPSCC